MLETKIAHLGFIQNIITRMSEKGSSIKTYAITIMAGALAVSDKIQTIPFIVFTITIILFLFYLNAYFYRQEKLFRELYQEVATTSNINFSNTFSLNTASYENRVHGIFKIVFTQKSHNLLKFYLPLIVCTICLKVFMDYKIECKITSSNTTQTNPTGDKK